LAQFLIHVDQDSRSVAATQQTMTAQALKSLVAYGAPNAGKSFLLNGLARYHAFDYEKGGRRQLRRIGRDLVETHDYAPQVVATHIKQHLEEEQPVIVVKLDSGRLRVVDSSLIKAVLAIWTDELPRLKVVVNQLSDKMMGELKANQQTYISYMAAPEDRHRVQLLFLEKHVGFDEDQEEVPWPRLRDDLFESLGVPCAQKDDVCHGRMAEPAELGKQADESKMDVEIGSCSTCEPTENTVPATPAASSALEIAAEQAMRTRSACPVSDLGSNLQPMSAAQDALRAAKRRSGEAAGSMLARLGVPRVVRRGRSSSLPPSLDRSRSALPVEATAADLDQVGLIFPVDLDDASSSGEHANPDSQAPQMQLRKRDRLRAAGREFAAGVGNMFMGVRGRRGASNSPQRHGDLEPVTRAPLQRSRRILQIIRPSSSTTATE